MSRYAGMIGSAGVVLVALAGCGESVSKTERELAVAPDASRDVQPRPAQPETASEPAASEVAVASSPAEATADATTDAPASAAVRFVPSMSGMPKGGMWKCDPVLVDINGDGALDLASIARKGFGPSVWFNDGKGNWTDASNGLTSTTGTRSCGGGLALGDANGDGNLDLIVADHCQGVYVYLGDGNGTWSCAVSALFAEEVVRDPELSQQFVGAEDLDVGDVNGDGHLDIVSASSDRAGLSVWIGDGTGTNWTWQPNSLPRDGWSNRVVLEDINQDGALDIITSYSRGPRVYLNDGTGQWSDGSEGLPSPRTHGIYHGVAIHDINNDGRLDIAVANWIDGPEVHLQNADGTWTKMPDVFPDMFGGAVGIAVGPLDADAHPDLIVTGRLTQEGGTSRGVFYLAGNGDGTFRHITDSDLPGEGLLAMTGATVGDIDGDSVADVVACSGLHVESRFGEASMPVIEERMLVWRTVRQAPKAD